MKIKNSVRQETRTGLPDIVPDRIANTPIGHRSLPLYGARKDRMHAIPSRYIEIHGPEDKIAQSLRPILFKIGY
ncbi:MAG: hypothetical protein WAN35_17510, partial [Terracidiphilus sp.]